MNNNIKNITFFWNNVKIEKPKRKKDGQKAFRKRTLHFTFISKQIEISRCSRNVSQKISKDKKILVFEHDLLETLVHSMPNRIQAVLKSKGNVTKYSSGNILI